MRRSLALQPLHKTGVVPRRVPAALASHHKRQFLCDTQVNYRAVQTE